MTAVGFIADEAGRESICLFSAAISIGRSLTGIAFLNRRAFDVSVGAEHATVAMQRAEQLTTALAVIEELAGVGGHFCFLHMAARGARQC